MFSPTTLAAMARLLPALGYAVLVFSVGSLPPGAERLPTSVNDKLLHAVVFGAMLPLNLRALRFLFPTISPGWALASAATVGVGLGGLLELHQLWFTRRSAELADWVADIVGIAIAAGVLWLVLAVLGAPAAGRSGEAPSGDP